MQITVTSNSPENIVPDNFFRYHVTGLFVTSSWLKRENKYADLVTYLHLLLKWLANPSKKEKKQILLGCKNDKFV